MHMESEEKVRNKVKRKLRIDEKRLINSFAGCNSVRKSRFR